MHTAPKSSIDYGCCSIQIFALTVKMRQPTLFWDINWILAGTSSYQGPMENCQLCCEILKAPGA